MTLLNAVVLVASYVANPSQESPVALGQVFQKNEKLAYEVRSSLSAQSRMRGLETWLPEDLDMNYDFTATVNEVKQDGIALIHYVRPVVHRILGETFDSPPKEVLEKLNWDYILTVSPINEILDTKDLNEKTGKPKKSSDDGAHVPAMARKSQVSLQAVLGQFIDEMFRLSLGIGGLDTSLDFSPKTPFDPVKIGDNWKRTVGYQPQTLKGKGNKQAVQRLDYTFTYKGVVDSNGKKVYRIQGDLDLKTDLAQFINQMANATPDETNLKKVPLTMKSTILFDLDLKSHHTLLAQMQTTSGVAIYATQYPDEPVEEVKIKAHSTMRLVGDKIIVPAKKS